LLRHARNVHTSRFSTTPHSSKPARQYQTQPKRNKTKQSVGSETRCKHCNGVLKFLGGFDRDGTPQKKKPSTPVTGFAAFTQTHYAVARSKGGLGGSHAQAMKELSVMWAMKKGTMSDETDDKVVDCTPRKNLQSRLIDQEQRQLNV
jgi:hypothetical protein